MHFIVGLSLEMLMEFQLPDQFDSGFTTSDDHYNKILVLSTCFTIRTVIITNKGTWGWTIEYFACGET